MDKYSIAGLLAVSFSLGVLLTVALAKTELKEEHNRGYTEGRVSALKDVAQGACANWDRGPISDCITKFQVIVGNLEEKGIVSTK